MTRIAHRRTNARTIDPANARDAALGHALARAAGVLIVLATLAAAFGGWLAVLL